MKTLGIDIGSMNVKAIVLGDKGILSIGVGSPGDDVETGARSVLESTVSQVGLSFDSLPLVATGVGAKLVSFTPQKKAINTCLARGVHHLHPSVRLVIDMGAESTSVIKINQRGRLADWASHDKCASGTGLFLQQMAKLMGMPLEQMAKLSLRAKARADITSTCAVFAESEVISHVHRDPPTTMEDIVAGIHYSIVSRVMSLCKRVGIEKDVAITGGVALNEGLVSILEQELGFEVLKPEAPQTIAALGAAIISRESAEKGIQR
ncbi:acyl-CoA dehydratase activase [Chloroflexota bacterium]